MRFIKKNGRVIPIRDGGSHGDAKGHGYTATGALAGTGILSYSAGAAVVQKGLQSGMYHPEAGFFGKRGKLGGALFLGGIGLMGASKVNALYHIMKAPKEERVGELAKHTAVAAVGYKVGSWASLPFVAHNLKTAAESFHYMMTGRKIDINAKSIYRAAKRFKGLASGGSGAPRIVSGK